MANSSSVGINTMYWLKYAGIYAGLYAGLVWNQIQYLRSISI